VTAIIHGDHHVSVHYCLDTLPFIELSVIFREKGSKGELSVESELVGFLSIFPQAIVQPIADQFVEEGADAITEFIKNVKEQQKR